MATDYDARRHTDDNDEPVPDTRGRRDTAHAPPDDVNDDIETGDAVDLPGADLSTLSGDDLVIRVQPRQADELTCTRCFLLFHRSHRARQGPHAVVCRDCA